MTCTGTRRKRHVAAAALVLAAMAVVTIPRLARAVSPSSDEMATTRRWVAAKFEAAQPLPKPRPGLLVLANHDPVTRNGRGSKPLRIVNAEYTRGLDSDARYAVTDLDTGATAPMTGRELGERGLPVSIPTQPGVAVMTYERVN